MLSWHPRVEDNYKKQTGRQWPIRPHLHMNKLMVLLDKSNSGDTPAGDQHDAQWHDVFDHTMSMQLTNCGAAEDATWRPARSAAAKRVMALEGAILPIECDSQDTKRSLGQMAEARVFNEEAVKEPLGGLDPGRMEKLTTNQYVACSAEADARASR